MCKVGPGGVEVWASAEASPDHSLPLHAEAPSCDSQAQYNPHRIADTLDIKLTFGNHLQEGDFDKTKCIKVLVPRISKTLNPNSHEHLLDNPSEQAREASSQWGPQSHMT